MVRLAGAISRRWRGLRIGAKFGAASGLLLAIVLLETVAGYAGLVIVRDAENTILASAEVQRLALDIGRNWESARRFQQAFFLLYPTIGVDKAYAMYALPAGGKISEMIRDGVTLQMRSPPSGSSDLLQQRSQHLSAYRLIIGEYAAALEEATELVARVAAEGTGLQAQLDQNTATLSARLQSAGIPPELLTLFYEMRFFEGEHRAGQRPDSLTSSLEAASRLRRAVTNGDLSAAESQAALAALDDYTRVAGQILETNAQIRERLDKLDRLNQTIEPHLVGLLATIHTEVSGARQQIDRTRRTTSIMLAGMIVLSLAAAGVIAIVLHRSVTRNIVSLTHTTREVQAGNLGARAPVNSADELGHLAHAFNEMTGQLSQTIARLVILREASLELARELDADHVMGVALQTATRLSGAGAGFIGLAEGDEIVIARTIGSYPPESAGARLPAGSGMVGRAAREKRTELQTNPASEPDGVHVIPGSRARVALPLVSGERVLGVLSVEADQPGQFSEDTIEFLELLATRTAVALDGARLYAEVERLATVDPLTRVYNRRGLFAPGVRELQRALRFGRPLAVLFTDIDYFKQFNDRYSYEVGDLVLRSVAQHIQANLRNVDLVGRYGGEEFVALLPELGLVEAVEVAERLRAAIERGRVHTDQGALAVTVSIGVAVFAAQPAASSTDDTEQALNHLIERAGQTLHLAKAGGRNRVVASGETHEDVFPTDALSAGAPPVNALPRMRSLSAAGPAGEGEGAARPAGRPARQPG